MRKIIYLLGLLGVLAMGTKAVQATDCCKPGAPCCVPGATCCKK